MKIKDLISEVRGFIGLRWSCQVEEVCYFLSEYFGKEVDSILIGIEELQSETVEELKMWLEEFDMVVALEIRSDGLKIIYELEGERLEDRLNIYRLSEDTFADIWNIIRSLSVTLYKWYKVTNR